MLRLGTLFAAALIGCLALRAEAVATSRIQFAVPRDGDLVAGPTEFRFEVSEQALAQKVDRIDVYVDGHFIGSALPARWTLTWEPSRPLSGSVIVALAYSSHEVVARDRIETATIAFDEHLEVTSVELFPVVVDRRGRYVSNLERKDFEVLDQGKPIPVESFSRTATTLSVALMIDTSGSMEKSLGVVEEAAITFLDALDEDDRISLYSFDQSVSAMISRSQDKAEAKKLVRELRAGGGTALYDAIIRVLGDFSGAPGRKAVLLFSDGRDVQSLSTLQGAVEKARRSDVIIYAIAGRDEKENRRGREDLEQLAAETGGQLLLVGKVKELPSLFSSVARDLRSQYHLSYSAPPGVAGQRQVEVRVKDDHLQVRCRKSYFFRGGS